MYAQERFLLKFLKHSYDSDLVLDGKDGIRTK